MVSLKMILLNTTSIKYIRDEGTYRFIQLIEGPSAPELVTGYQLNVNESLEMIITKIDVAGSNRVVR